jgi:hypothetical protein
MNDEIKITKKKKLSERMNCVNKIKTNKFFKKKNQYVVLLR